MFAKTTNVGFAQRVVATLVASAMVLWSIGAYSSAQAANLTFVSDTLSTSAPSVTASHLIKFTIPTGSTLDAASTFTIALPTSPGSGFTGVATVVGGDVTATVNGAGAQDSFSVLGQVITLSLNTTANAGDEVVVAIADGKIVNPDTIGAGDPGTSGEIVITTPNDIGKTRVAIVDTVLVTAQVNSTFDFTITGLATSTAINGTSTTGSTTATEIPFGLLVVGEVKTLAQRLNVSTNAQHGFIVTVEQDGNLRSANGADIDGFIDGAYTDAPAAWQSPANTLLNEDTYGHWGLTTEDGDLKGSGNDFASADTWVAASTTPRVVMAHDGPSDGTTQTPDSTGDDVGQTDVGYQIEITPLQEAADDYQTTLTYIATPTF